jgi:hypothetical protein
VCVCARVCVCVCVCAQEEGALSHTPAGHMHGWTCTHEQPALAASRYCYDARSLTWGADGVVVKIEPEPFAQGGMRAAYRCLRQLPSGMWRRMVAKRYLQPSHRCVLVPLGLPDSA